MATAAHTVLVGVVPNFGTPAQKVAASALLEEAYTAAMSRSAAGPAKVQGVTVGRAAGAAILALRKDDGVTRDAIPQGRGRVSGGRIPTRIPRIPRSPIRTWRAAISPRSCRAGAM